MQAIHPNTSTGMICDNTKFGIGRRHLAANRKWRRGANSDTGRCHLDLGIVLMICNQSGLHGILNVLLDLRRLNWSYKGSLLYRCFARLTLAGGSFFPWTITTDSFPSLFLFATVAWIYLQLDSFMFFFIPHFCILFRNWSSLYAELERLQDSYRCTNVLRKWYGASPIIRFTSAIFWPSSS